MCSVAILQMCNRSVRDFDRNKIMNPLKCTYISVISVKIGENEKIRYTRFTRRVGDENEYTRTEKSMQNL